METEPTRLDAADRWPTPVRIDALLARTRFDSSLIHYTPEQWKHSVEKLGEVKRLPDEAVRMMALELPGGFGVVGNTFVGCPPGCQPIGGRGIVCPDLGILDRLPDDRDVGYTPHPDCWFEPQCICEPDGEDIFDRNGSDDCVDTNCRFGFQPVVVRVGEERVVTVTRFGCRKIGGDCKRCRVVIERSGLGIYRLGCECVCD